MATQQWQFIPAGVTDSVFSLPPGRAELGCSTDATREGPGNTDGEPVAIEVRDPLGAWRTGALAALGCQAHPQASTGFISSPGGSSREAALRALVDQMPEPTTWQAAQEGYVAANRQGYLLLHDGKPWVSVGTHRVTDGCYSVAPEAYCNDAGPHL